MIFWTLEEAKKLCIQIEKFCPSYGVHIGIVGGLVTQDGPRKDADFILYRIEPSTRAGALDLGGLHKRFVEFGFTQLTRHPQHWKGFYNHRMVDVMMPQWPEP